VKQQQDIPGACFQEFTDHDSITGLVTQKLDMLFSLSGAGSLSFKKYFELSKTIVRIKLDN
jgi:hypothetical protein